MTHLEVVLKNQPGELARLHKILAEFAAGNRVSTKIVARMDLAFQELVSNIMQYAFPKLGDHQILVTLDLRDGTLVARIEDDGIPFDPVSYPAPDITLPLDQKPIGGLGIHMARKSVDRMEYHRVNDRNQLTLSIRNRQGSASPR